MQRFPFTCSALPGRENVLGSLYSISLLQISREFFGEYCPWEFNVTGKKILFVLKKNHFYTLRIKKESLLHSQHWERITITLLALGKNHYYTLGICYIQNSQLVHKFYQHHMLNQLIALLMDADPQNSTLCQENIMCMHLQ